MEQDSRSSRISKSGICWLEKKKVEPLRPDLPKRAYNSVVSIRLWRRELVSID